MSHDHLSSLFLTVLGLVSAAGCGSDTPGPKAPNAGAGGITAGAAV